MMPLCPEWFSLMYSDTCLRFLQLMNDIEMFVLMQENLHIVGFVIFNDFIIVVIVSLVAVAVIAKIWHL